LGWGRGPLGATLFANYVGNYLNNTPLPGRTNEEVASWTTFDLNLSFDFGKLSNPGWLNGTVVSLSSQNLFDRGPPRVLAGTGLNAFDPNNANFFGRIMTDPHTG
jgi:hypothetical protein